MPPCSYYYSIPARDLPVLFFIGTLIASAMAAHAVSAVVAPRATTEQLPQPTDRNNSSIAKCCAEKGLDEATVKLMCGQDPLQLPALQFRTFVKTISARDFLNGNETAVREYLRCVLSGGAGVFASNVSECCDEVKSLHSDGCPLTRLCGDTGLILANDTQWRAMFGRCSTTQRRLVGDCFRYGTSPTDSNNNVTVTPGDEKPHPLHLIPSLPLWANLAIEASVLLLLLGLLGLGLGLLIHHIIETRRRDWALRMAMIEDPVITPYLPNQPPLDDASLPDDDDDDSDAAGTGLDAEVKPESIADSDADQLSANESADAMPDVEEAEPTATATIESKAVGKPVPEKKPAKWPTVVPSHSAGPSWAPFGRHR